MTKNDNPHYGSRFEDFLKEEGLLDECTLASIKTVLAYQIAEEMEKQHLTKTQMAERMNTTRRQLDRLLSKPEEDIGLNMVMRAARAIGRNVHITLT